jgi:hypothetical protein
MAINSVAVANTDTDLILVPDPFVGWDPATSDQPPVRYAITTIMVCNTTVPNPVHEEDGLTNFDMHLVKKDDPKNDTNKVINVLELPAGETFTFDSEKIILESGDRIVIVGDSPTTLSATVSYLEV